MPRRNAILAASPYNGYWWAALGGLWIFGPPADDVYFPATDVGLASIGKVESQ